MHNFEEHTYVSNIQSSSALTFKWTNFARGSVYKLNNFYGSRNKSVFRVADHTATVSFSWDSKLSVLRDCRTPFDEDSFRFHSYEEFQANSDLKGDLFDYKRMKKTFKLSLDPPSNQNSKLINYVIQIMPQKSYHKTAIK
ncbi:hypothetical protein YC2023_016817 [Brassica napus]